MPCKVKVRFSGFKLSGLTRVNTVRARTGTFLSFTAIPSHRLPVLELYAYSSILSQSDAHPSHIHPFPILYPSLCSCPHFPSLQFPFDSTLPRIRAPYSLSIFHFYASSRNTDVTSFSENPTDLTLERKSTRDAQRRVAR